MARYTNLKCSRDILEIGDVWSVDTSDLELQNADTKRTGTTSGSKCLEMRSAGSIRVPVHGEAECQREAETF